MNFILYGGAIFALLVLYVYIRGRRLISVTNYFYTNTKPYLGKMGFEGEAGWCTEEQDFIDNLYYLRNPRLSKAFADLPADTLRNWFMDEIDCVDDDEEPVGRRYSIAFMAVVTSRFNKGILSLTSHARGEKYHEDLVHIYAPISYFSNTAITCLLPILRRNIEKCESAKKPESLFMMSGIQDNSNEHTIYDLAYYSSADKPTKSKRKKAQKIMRYGYSN
jgi:hypothetical protein